MSKSTTNKQIIIYRLAVCLLGCLLGALLCSGLGLWIYAIIYGLVHDGYGYWRYIWAGIGCFCVAAVDYVIMLPIFFEIDDIERGW